jgi:hypothetical protein
MSLKRPPSQSKALRAELGDALAEACGGLERRIVDQLYLVENRVSTVIISLFTSKSARRQLI